MLLNKKIIRAILTTTAFTISSINTTIAEKPAAKTPSAEKPKQADAVFDSSFSKLPTNITSDTLTLHQDQRVFVYEGNVKVVQGDMTLTSKTLEGTYNEQNQIEKLVAKGDVLITKADIKATSQQALYEAAGSTVTLIDNPQLEQNGSVLTADKIRIFLDDNRSQAEGQVRVNLVNKDNSPKPVSAALAGATPTPAITATSTAVPAPTKANKK